MANKRPNLTLKNRADFINVREKGASFRVSDWLLFSFVKSEGPTLRVGWTYPTYVGPAVVRNRFKRWSREFVQSLSPTAKRMTADVNLLLRKKNTQFYRNVTHEEFDATLAKGFRKLEITFK